MKPRIGARIDRRQRPETIERIIRDSQKGETGLGKILGFRWRVTRITARLFSPRPRHRCRCRRCRHRCGRRCIAATQQRVKEMFFVFSRPRG